MESGAWDQFSEDYDEKVFSLTSFPERRGQILARIRNGRVLNLGCGPTPYLNRDLVQQGNTVMATDFCQAMLDVAARGFSHPNLTYRLADSRHLPFGDGTFDSIISVNSILPPRREDVCLMIEEIYRVLANGGVFVAFLCSYDNVKAAIEDVGLEAVTDDARLRVKDTTGWQCFHTPASIAEMMGSAGFSGYELEKVLLDTSAEIAEFKRLYGVDTSVFHMHEYLLVAHK